jgi:SPP1 family predicted phage head-tail adaptor
MRISKLQQRITVQRRSTTLDAYGQEINSWTNIGTVWAEVKPLSGTEKM